jgi:hypothetical protein
MYLSDTRKIEGGRDASQDGTAIGDQDDEGGEWYLGKAKAEFERRHREGANVDGPRDAEEDLIEVSDCTFNWLGAHVFFL